MHRIYQRIFFIVALMFSSQFIMAQDTTGVSVDPLLQDIYKSKFPIEYTIAGITVTGTVSFDANLIVSISGLAVGDKVKIPGTDIFGKAISKLWKQNLISAVDIYFTKLEGKNLFIEIAVTERPRLSDFKLVKAHPMLLDLTSQQIDGIINYMRAKNQNDKWLETIEFNHKLDATRDQSFTNVTPEFLPYV